MMTLDKAISGSRRLQAEADAGWPSGFDLESVRTEAEGYLAVFAAASTTSEKAREIIDAIENMALIW